MTARQHMWVEMDQYGAPVYHLEREGDFSEGRSWNDQYDFFSDRVYSGDGMSIASPEWSD